MKIALCLLLTGLVLGCATTDKAVFRETANQNVLDLGSSRIYIDKRFVLVGDLKGETHADNIDDKHGTDFRVTRYVLADTTDGTDKIKRAIIVMDVRMVKSTQYFLGDASYSGYNGAHIEKGMTEKIGVRCAYLMHLIGAAPKDVLDLMKTNGFSVAPGARTGVEVAFAKHVGSSRRVNIIYVEAGDASQAKAVFENAVHFIRFEM